METTIRNGAGLTRELMRRALAVRYEDLPGAVRQVARDCLVDWLGCAHAGQREPACRIVRDAVREEGGAAQATLVGSPFKVSASQAALVNGTASHALDYDDVNLVLPGHVSVAVLPALLALAEYRQASSSEFVAAFVAGYETACRIGALVEPAHYANGFHATATIGSLGAAAACAHLLKLTESEACHAIGVAATQAAGLKAMFGGMAKPLHAGMAAQTGVRSALWARQGFTSRPDALECAQGFALAHGKDFHVRHALSEPASGYHLLGNLFKFHAACFSTHATIEAVQALRLDHELPPAWVECIRVTAGTPCSICNIPSPATGLQAKFSLRAAAAFALLGMDTSRLDTWDRVTEDAVQATLERVRVELVPGMGLSESVVALRMADGRSFERAASVGSPMVDKAEQSRRVDRKFLAIVSPLIGYDRSSRILDRLTAMTDDASSSASLTSLFLDCLA